MTSNVVPIRQSAPAAKPSEDERRPRRAFGKLRQLPSKRWHASYVDPNGDRQNAPVTFPTKTDATAWLDMRHAEIVEHRWKPTPPAEPSKVTFHAYAADWMKDRELKPRTRAEYQRILDAKLVPEFGRRLLTSITAADIDAWYRGLDADKPTARAHAYALLRTIMGTAASSSPPMIENNPVHIRGAASLKRQRTIRPATVAELTAIIEALPPRYQALALLASWTALRFGEVTELRRKDVDLEEGMIHVSRAVTWPNGVATVSTPKSEAGIRTVTIPPHIVPALEDHLTKFAQPGAEGLVFPNTDGGHIHHGSLYKVFKPARAKAGRPDLTFHGLRHTGATMAAQTGATLAELMNRLGHSTVAAALRYQHAATARDAEIARKLSAMAKGAK